MKIEELQKALSEIDPNKLELFKNHIGHYRSIIILGNGGSNAVTQHIAQDYTKVLGKKALCFADASRLTCYINDYGQNLAYRKFLEHFADEDTLVILISSSGESENIRACLLWCVVEDVTCVVLTGFNRNSKMVLDMLNIKDDYKPLHFWVDSNDYGVVELTHEAILHSIC